MLRKLAFAALLIGQSFAAETESKYQQALEVLTKNRKFMDAVFGELKLLNHGQSEISSEGQEEVFALMQREEVIRKFAELMKKYQGKKFTPVQLIQDFAEDDDGLTDLLIPDPTRRAEVKKNLKALAQDKGRIKAIVEMDEAQTQEFVGKILKVMTADQVKEIQEIMEGK